MNRNSSVGGDMNSAVALGEIFTKRIRKLTVSFVSSQQFSAECNIVLIHVVFHHRVEKVKMFR